MNKIKQAFQNSSSPLFIPFVTAGDPSLESTERFLLAMSRAGADILELGVPFSDPIADGEVIERANLRALKAGATVESVFALCERVSKQIDTPLVLLTYLNPVFHMGYDVFCERCVRSGVSGLVIPDLPLEERGEVTAIAEKHGVAIIPLVAPTSEQRIGALAKEAGEGFLYVVSSLGITGVRREITTDLSAIISAAKAANPSCSCAVGFGISTPEQAKRVAAQADGVIVGSACVKLVEQLGEGAEAELAGYVRAMKSAVASS